MKGERNPAVELTARHVFLELLELHQRPLHLLLDLLDLRLGATLLDRVDDQEGEHEEHEDEDEDEEQALKSQLKSSKLHR